MAITVDKLVVDMVVKGQSDIDKLGKSIDLVAGKTANLTNALAGIGLAAFIKNTLDAADRMSDLADATGMAIGKIAAFENALTSAGGKAKNAERVITSFYQAIETANDGSLKARDAFDKVGVSLDMLKNASEQDILSTALSGLSKMEAGSERTAIATTLLSKAFRGVDPKAFQDALNSGNFTQLEASVKANADAAQKLEQAYKNLQLGAMNAITPILKMFGDGNLTVETSTKLITALGVAYGLAFSANLIANVIMLNKAILGTAAAASLLGKNPVIKVLAGLALTATAGTAAFIAYDAAISSMDQNQKDAAESAAELQRLMAKGPQAAATTNTPAGRTQAAVVDPRQKALEESKSRIAVYEAERNKFNDLAIVGGNQLAQIEINKEFEIKQARAEIKAKEHLSDAQRTKETAEKIASINAKYAKDETEYRRNLYIKVYQDQVAIAEENAKLIAEQETAYQKAAAAAQGIATEYGKQITLMGDRITLENGLLLLSTQDADLKRKLFDLEQGRLAKVEEINKQVQDGKLAYSDSLLSIQKINDANTKGIEILKQQAEITKQKQNDPIAALRDSLKKFGEDNTPFKQTQKEVEVLFNGMNSAIDNFVETGKFKFGDFASSVIKDLIKIELKAQATTLLRTFIGSFIPGAGTLGARAEGGPVNANTPYLVGERGPELFMPKGNGNIVPNDALGGGGGGVSNTAITYNIQAVDASSFRSLVASDPEFMYAVTEQGRRRQPSRRRV